MDSKPTIDRLLTPIEKLNTLIATTSEQNQQGWIAQLEEYCEELEDMLE